MTMVLYINTSIIIIIIIIIIAITERGGHQCIARVQDSLTIHWLLLRFRRRQD